MSIRRRVIAAACPLVTTLAWDALILFSRLAEARRSIASNPLLNGAAALEHILIALAEDGDL